MRKCLARQYSDQMVCSCGLSWDVNDPDPPKYKPLPAVSKDTVALVGFLAARLACYEPDGNAVKQALEYLSRQT